jgi:hypothetical protein
VAICTKPLDEEVERSILKLVSFVERSDQTRRATPLEGLVASKFAGALGGGGVMVAVVVALPVAPRLSVTVSVTVNVPVAL